MRERAIGTDMVGASLFLNGAFGNAIVVDLEAITLHFKAPGGHVDPGTDSTLMAVEHDKQLYREYVRYLLSSSRPRMPAWFEEGLSQILMRMKVLDSRTIEYAVLDDPNMISAEAGQRVALKMSSDPSTGGDGLGDVLPGAPTEDKDFSAALRRRPLLNLQRLFSVNHGASETVNPLGNNIWSKQAYAFVHMCLYGEGGKFRKPFTVFLQRAADRAPTEALFQECFGMSYRQMLVQIRSYCDFTVYESKGVRSKRGEADLIKPPKAVALREATQSEVGRIKGDAFVLAGKPALARSEYITAYLRGERDAALLASLGICERETGDRKRALQLLEASYAAKTDRVDALLALARLRFEDGLGSPAGPNGKLSLAQARAVVEPILPTTSRQTPTHAVYDLMGDAWERCAEKPSREEAVSVITGAMLFPNRLKLVYQSISLAAGIGDVKSAHALSDHGIKHATDDRQRIYFESAKAALPAR